MITTPESSTMAFQETRLKHSRVKVEHSIDSNAKLWQQAMHQLDSSKSICLKLITSSIKIDLKKENYSR